MNECSETNSNPNDDRLLEENLSRIEHTLMVLSGKGGVGKSTVAVNLALSLTLKGYRVGLLDVDIHGPSIPKMLGLSGRTLPVADEQIIPIQCYGNLSVVSMGLLINEEHQPVIWRGPLKYNVIKEFLQHVRWGNLHYLVIDAPPGTGDEPLSIAQLVKERKSAVIVTTPQQVATIDVAKCITFCNQLNLPVAGIIENMSGFICPHCGKEVAIFSSGGGEQLAARHNVPFLGKVPLDPDIVKSGDEGSPYVLFYGKTKTAEVFDEIVNRIVATQEVGKIWLPMAEGTNVADPPGPQAGPDEKTHALPVRDGGQAVDKGDSTMRFAVPTHERKLCQHFGHCEAFAIIETAGNGAILKEEYVPAPEHQPGLLPGWLAERGVSCVIAGGMGSRAKQLFAEKGVTVVTGAQGEYPREVVENYLKGTLVTGANTCDH